MKRILSRNPYNGITEIFHHDPVTDVTTIETVQDVEAALNETKRRANDTDYTRAGMKKGWLHYAYLPDIVILQLKTKYNLNVFSKEDSKAVFRVINRDYPHLKTTAMRHNPKGT